MIAATTSARRPVRAGLCCAVIWTLAHAAIGLAAAPEPVLRLSEQLDARRLGKVSEGERSVLRVQWRAALTGAEETQSVQQILDSLRRMDDTVREIARVINTMPVQKPAAVAAAIEPPEPAKNGRNLALGAGLAAALLGLYWFARRRSAVAPAPVAAIATGPDTGPPVESPREEKLPEQAPLADSGPGKPPITGRQAAAEVPGPVRQGTGTGGGARVIDTQEWAAQTVITTPPKAEERPPVKAPRKPTPEQANASVAAPAPSNAIDFSLEDADPAVVARENARVPVPRKPDAGSRNPERRQELHVEPTLQLAEIMLSMGLQQGAAQALVDYIDANPRQAVYHWLKLLAIYRDAGQRKDFADTAEKLRKHFNIQAADPATTGAGAAPTLESFPRVAEQVRRLWLQPTDCLAYLHHLLEDNREGSRIGFPQSVAEELLLLIEILKTTSGAGQAAGTQRSTT